MRRWCGVVGDECPLNERMFDTPDCQEAPVVATGLDRALAVADRMLQAIEGGQTRSTRRIGTIEKIKQVNKQR